MVFSSVTPFLDHYNWHQQLQQSSHQQGITAGAGENPSLQPPLAPPQHGGAGGGGGGDGSIRPGSMVDRARLAKLPMPEPGLNCPRCDSTNTKFCYFNNYSLTQPRHFCKTCRRYWTRGGALRNVPVGGGCRRNKRSNKNNRRSKSPSQKGAKSISGSPSRCSTDNIATATQVPHPPSLQLPFMSSSYGGIAGNITSNLGGFHPQSEMAANFQLGTAGSSNNGNNFNSILSIGSGENWRLPFVAGFEVPSNTNLFHYQSDQGAVEAPVSSIIENSHVDPPVKVEENREVNLSRQTLGSENTNQQAWPLGNTWGQFSGVSTSSTPTTHFI